MNAIVRPVTQSPFDFFFKHAGWSYDPRKESKRQGRARCAKELAYAEKQAAAGACYYEWRYCDTDSSDFSDEKPAWRLWQCSMFNADGDVIQALCAIDFGRNGEPWGDPNKRVVEAELACEVFK